MPGEHAQPDATNPVPEDRPAFSDPLPHDPIPVLSRWLSEAESATRTDPRAPPDWNAMVLATATPDAAPSARVVLCKQLEPAPPAIVFYTNYESRKARELEANPRAAAVFFWPHLHRQARVEGRIARTSAEESDAYFRSRPYLSRLGAIASRQSRPLSSRSELLARVALTAASSPTASTRPEQWGGYRLIISHVELWHAAPGRLHDRAAWTLGPSSWSSTRLFP